jgi:molybdate transport system permease protein
VDWTAIRLTFAVATCTTAILFVLGLPLAAWLARPGSGWRFLIEAVVALPLVLPPTVLGFYILWAAGPHSLPGRWYKVLFGSQLPFTFQGVVVASVLYNLPFAVRPFTAALAAVDRKLVEASWCLGVSRLETFRRVTLPLAWRGILAGLVLTFAHAVGEFGIVLMVGGNRPGVTRTLAVAIYDDVQAMDYAAAARSSLFLVMFAFTVMSVLHLLQQRTRPAP